jgi:hypothetical protein
MMKRRLLFGSIMLAISTACAPPTLYQWGNYEGSLYQLMKDPTSFDKYGLALNDQIVKTEATGNIPPGIYAEYGYYVVASRKHSEAIVWFEKEKSKWPESTLLMDKMILTCRNPRSKDVEAKPAAEVKPTTQPAAGSVQ